VASRSLGTLTLDLIAKIGGFVAGMTQAERVANKKLSDIEKRAYAFGKAMGGAIKVGLAAATTAATAAVAVLGKTIDSMDELSKAAKTVGLTTEEFSRLSYAADLANVSQEELKSGLGRLIKAQAAAMNSTSQQAKIFKALGIEVKNADGSMRATTDVMLDFSDRFKLLKGSPEALAAGLQIFGRGFQTFVPLINDGSDAIRELMHESDVLGKTLSTSAGRDAEQFNDNLTRLKTAVGGLAQQVATDLLPDLVQLTDGFVDATKAGNNSASVAHEIANAFRAVGEVVGFVGDLMATFGNRVEGLTESMVGLYQIASGLTSLDWTRLRAGAESLKEGGLEFLSGNRRQQASGPDFSDVTSGSKSFSLDAQVKQIKEARAQAEALRKALGDPDPKKKTGGRAKKAGKSEEVKEQEELKQAYARANESLSRELELVGKTTEAEQLSYELKSGALAKLEPLKKAELLSLAESLDMKRDELELVEKLDSEHDKRQEQAQDVIDSIRQEGETLGMSSEQWELYNNIKRAGADVSSENIAAITEETKALQEQRKALEPQIAIMDEFREGLEDTVADVISGNKSIKDAFKDLFDDLAAQITRWIARRLIEQAFGGQGTVGQGGSSGGWIGNLLGAFFGSGGGRAAGGMVMPWQSYRVNENGPELLSMGNRDYLMMGSRAGRVISQPSAMGASYGDTNIYVQGSATRETIKQIDRANGRRARRELGRTGG